MNIAEEVMQVGPVFDGLLEALVHGPLIVGERRASVQLLLVCHLHHGSFLSAIVCQFDVDLWARHHGIADQAVVLHRLKVRMVRWMLLEALRGVELGLEVVNLALELSDNRPVLADKQLVLLQLFALLCMGELLLLRLKEFLLLLDRIHEVAGHYILDMAGPGRVLQSVEGLLVSSVKLTDAGEHHCLRVAAQRVLQQPRQLAVSVPDEVPLQQARLLRLVAQRVDAISEG